MVIFYVNILQTLQHTDGKSLMLAQYLPPGAQVDTEPSVPVKPSHQFHHLISKTFCCLFYDIPQCSIELQLGLLDILLSWKIERGRQLV